MSKDCDVLIVGGGPAGLAAAEAAAKEGVETLVLERQHEIGYPIHTSGGSWVSDMQALNIPQSLYHPIHKVIFVSPQREVSMHYNPAVACVVDVRGLYQASRQPRNCRGSSTARSPYRRANIDGRRPYLWGESKEPCQRAYHHTFGSHY